MWEPRLRSRSDIIGTTKMSSPTTFLQISWTGVNNRRMNTRLIDTFDYDFNHKITYSEDERTPHTPVITKGISSTDEFIAWTSRDLRLNLAGMNIWLGIMHTKTVSLETSHYGPGMTADGSVITWTGTDSRLNFGVDLKRDGLFTYKYTLNDRCYSTPNVISLDEDRVLAGWRGSDRRLKFLVFNLETEKAEKRIAINETSQYAPALSVFQIRGGEVVSIAWTAMSGGVYVGQLSLDSRSLLWQTPVYERSSRAPGIATFKSKIYVAWTGTDRKLNIGTIENKAKSGHITLQETSTQGPSLTHMVVSSS